MKYTIEGFSQEEAIRLGLDIKDLVFLRWLVDFQGTGKMEIFLKDSMPWYWIHYPKIAAELPILGISHDKVWSRRIRSLQKCRVIEILTAGGRTYFRFVEQALLALLTSTNGQRELFRTTGNSKVPQGTQKFRAPKKRSLGTQKFQNGNSKVPDNNDSSINDSSIKQQQPDQKSGPAPSCEKPVENSKTEHSSAFKVRAAKAQAAGFNIYKLTNRFYKQSKIIKSLPEEVLSGVLDEVERFSGEINDQWAYFLTVLRAKSERYFARKNREDGEKYKKEPAELGRILAGMMLDAGGEAQKP